eukprot:SAG11_NODE_7635_length_1119_cov_3.058881_1_plen_42_part_00
MAAVQILLENIHMQIWYILGGGGIENTTRKSILSGTHVLDF